MNEAKHTPSFADLLAALERLSAQCERLRLPGQKMTDAEQNALDVIAHATGK